MARTMLASMCSTMSAASFSEVSATRATSAIRFALVSLWIAQRFLDYLGRKCIAVEAAHAPEREDFLRWELRSWRRQAIEDYTVCLRSFLRYLHGSGRTALDLSSTVIGPRIYDDEQIPSALRPEEVQTVVEATRQDCSPIGRRDYAFLMLLATYG